MLHFSLDGTQKLLLGKTCFLTEKDHFSFHSEATDLQKSSNSSLRNSSAVKVAYLVIESSFFLSKLQSVGRMGVSFSAEAAAKTLNEAGLRSAVEASVFLDKFFGSMKFAVLVRAWGDHDPGKSKRRTEKLYSKP